jgi:hypothetical protein
MAALMYPLPLQGERVRERGQYGRLCREPLPGSLLSQPSPAKGGEGFI